MITVLERQHVSKRVPSPVAQRARSEGVRWSMREPRALQQNPAPRKDSRAPRTAAAASPWRQPKLQHSFLQNQLVKAKQRRGIRKTERFLQRIATRQKVDRHRPLAPKAERRTPAKPRVLRQQETRLRQAGAEGTGQGLLLRVLRNPWLFIAIASAAALCLTFAAAFPNALSSLSFAGLSASQEHPSFPASPDVDQALYTLLLPEEERDASATVSPVLIDRLKIAKYTTQAGDSLSKIASRFRLNVDTIVSWNDIRDARRMPTGTVLEIPSSDGLKYTVRRGDTLQGIASAWGVDFNGILDSNMLASSVITVGQRLFLPGARMNSTELNRILGSLFIWPVTGPITDRFGMRKDPFTGQPDFHIGIDIKGALGTPIAAAGAGSVADAGFNFTYGNYVIIKHSGGYQTLYGHLTRSVVVRGQKVQQGQKIGELGTTGYSTGPHLHFSVFLNGKPVDPQRFLP